MANRNAASPAAKPLADPAANVTATPTDQFKLGVRERLRLAPEVAGLRARFAAVVEDYERVIRTMQALEPSVGLMPTEIRHATNPQWGPSALLTYADGHFLKAEQEGGPTTAETSLKRFRRRLPGRADAGVAAIRP